MRLPLYWLSGLSSYLRDEGHFFVFKGFLSFLTWWPLLEPQPPWEAVDMILNGFQMRDSYRPLTGHVDWPSSFAWPLLPCWLLTHGSGGIDLGEKQQESLEVDCLLPCTWLYGRCWPWWGPTEKGLDWLLVQVFQWEGRKWGEHSWLEDRQQHSCAPGDWIKANLKSRGGEITFSLLKVACCKKVLRVMGTN